MAKQIQEVNQDRLARFNEIVQDIAECKAHIKATQDYMYGKEKELIELFSDIDPTSDFEGTESMQSDRYQVGFIYKLTRKVDKEKADEALMDIGRKPEELFTVKYDYSAQIYRNLDDEARKAVQDSMVTKRAKTSIEIKPRITEGEEE